MAPTSSMTLKDWVDLFTGGGAAISAIAAGEAAWAARTSARAAKESSEATRAAIHSNEKIADNDRRIRLMEERLKIWRAFDELMATFERWGYVGEELLKARESFQFAQCLFASEIHDYLRVLDEKMTKHSMLHTWSQSGAAVLDLGQETQEQRQEKINNMNNLALWILSQKRIGKALFSRHMNITY